MAASQISTWSLLVGLSTAAVIQSTSIRQEAAPSVQVRNGSYYGQFNANYNQDMFLGIPYAQPPVDDLRFRPPQPLSTTWNGTRNATEYSPQCFGYGSDTWVLGNYVSEDCLTINVVRPHGVSSDAALPVAVWIHGGGLTNGGSSDPRYNLSFIVNQGVDMGTPFIAASINYRLSAWGFLFSSELKAEGAGNIGFRDQRLALQWVQENIASFGGNPGQVTIWGESAGGRSVGAQLLAFGGRDDGLFHAAIMESGVGVTALEMDFGEVASTTPNYQDIYDRIVDKTNCSASVDTLRCLRRVPTWTLSDIINSTSISSWQASVDGDFLPTKPSTLLKDGQFVKVPIINGANFDEGAQFGTKGINTTAQWESYLTTLGANNATIEQLSTLYPDIPSLGLPATLEGRPEGQYAYYGTQWKRAVAFGGDRSIHAPKRQWTRYWAAANVTAYSYHFNVLVNGIKFLEGANHFVEVAFVFNNTNGLGYETVVAKNPFEGEPETFFELANIMSRMWVSFITKHDPNFNGVTDVAWPVYELHAPQNMAFDVNISSIAYVEPDTYRAEQIDYLIAKLW